jgi:hypothetical protein
MPDMNNRSPARAAKESGGALTPGGAGTCWILDMEASGRFDASPPRRPDHGPNGGHHSTAAILLQARDLRHHRKNAFGPLGMIFSENRCTLFRIMP